MSESVSQTPGDPTTPQSPGSFSPEKYITKLSRRQRLPDGQWKNVDLDYLEVKWRILWLRTVEPLAKIHTELVKHEGDLAIFKTTVILPSGAEASGYGSETTDDWRDNIEKAETKSLGRALAALGFGIQHVGQDFDLEQEQSQASRQRIADAPVERPKANTAAPPRTPSTPSPTASSSTLTASPPTQRPTSSPVSSTNSPNGGGQNWTALPATEPQLKAIHAIAKGQHGWDNDQLSMWIGSRFETAIEGLTKQQASNAIEALKGGDIHPKQAASGPVTDGQITAAQTRAITALMQQANTDPAAFLTWIQTDFGAAAIASLSAADAETIIAAFHGMLEQPAS